MSKPGEGDVRDVYRKSEERSVYMLHTYGRELRAVAGLGCAPAIGVHRPYCACGRDEQAGTQEVQ
jgi:hypothetical protein